MTSRLKMNSTKDCSSQRNKEPSLATKTDKIPRMPITNFRATKRGKKSMRIPNRRETTTKKNLAKNYRTNKKTTIVIATFDLC